MKKLITLTIALFVLATVNVYGQAETATATVSANIFGTLTIAQNVGDLDFGDVTTGSTPSILAADGARFDIGADDGATIFVDVPTSVELTGGVGGSVWFRTAGEVLTNATDDAGTAGAYTDNSTSYTASSPDGDFYVWVGGTLSDEELANTNIATGKTGAKTGTLTVGVSYVSF